VKRFVTLATLVATLVAVASIFPAAVAQGQTAANESGRLGWCELLTHDAAKAAQFYAELFGWQLENHTAGKYRLRSQGTLVGGITEIGYITPELDEATWLVGITVDDVEASVAAARERGGKILADVTRATSGARWAVVEDLQGAQLLVFSGGDLIDDTEGPGRWMWTELWTTDPEDAAAFYADVVGWTLEELEHPDGAYPAFHKGGEARAGLEARARARRAGTARAERRDLRRASRGSGRSDRRRLPGVRTRGGVGMKRVTRWICLGLFGVLLVIGLGSCASSGTTTSLHVGVGYGYGGYGGYGRGWGYSPGYRPGRPIGRPPGGARPTPYRDVPAPPADYAP